MIVPLEITKILDRTLWTAPTCQASYLYGSIGSTNLISKKKTIANTLKISDYYSVLKKSNCRELEYVIRSVNIEDFKLHLCHGYDTILDIINFFDFIPKQIKNCK